MRTGFTTGTCAAGAAKAAAIFLRTGKIVNDVVVKNLEGKNFFLKVFREGKNFCVIKDSGDDKADVTNGVKVCARVEFANGYGEIIFSAGDGVGVVTLPGLKIPVGEPAINPVPRKMIALALREVIPRKSLRVIISIPNGEIIARKTFNARLGIIGGLSILGTSGIVKPMNEAALLQSLSLELNMIFSLGFREVYITFAGTGEKFLRKIFRVETRNVIQCGNFPGYILDEAVKLGFSRAVICGHPGKLLKVASGSFNTHSKNTGGQLETLCAHLAMMGANSEIVKKVFHANTTTEAIEIVKNENFFDVWNVLAKIVSEKCEQRANNSMKIDAVFIDNDGNILGRPVGGGCVVAGGLPKSI